jgi:LPXTG-motif cell wall-anchored protein
MRSRTLRGSAAIIALTAAALIGTAGSALACHSDDNRPHPTPGKATPCAEGTDLSQGDVVAKITNNRLAITKVNEGVTVKRIVVIGGDDGFNDYTPGARGLDKSAPWTDLRAPFSRNGHQAGIDKWYLCGTKTKPTETTKPPTTSQTSKPTESTSAPSSETVKPTSTTSAAPVPAGNESGTGGGLANTGFDNMWLVWIAALLILGGGGLLALLKFRRKASE